MFQSFFSAIEPTVDTEPAAIVHPVETDDDTVVDDISDSGTDVVGEYSPTHPYLDAVRRELFPCSRREDIMDWLRNWVCKYATDMKLVFISSADILDQLVGSGIASYTENWALACFNRAYSISHHSSHYIVGEAEYRMFHVEGNYVDFTNCNFITFKHEWTVPDIDYVTAKTLYRYLMEFPVSSLRDFNTAKRIISGLYYNTHILEGFETCTPFLRSIVADIKHLDDFTPPNTRAFYTKQKWYDVICENDNAAITVAGTFKTRDVAEGFMRGCKWCDQDGFVWSIVMRERNKTYVYTVIYPDEPEESTTPEYIIKVAQSIWNKDSKHKLWTNTVKRAHVKTCLGRIAKDLGHTFTSYYIPKHSEIKKMYIMNR
jgi:hypothetical protein